MQVTTSKQEEKFQPIEITIKFENLQEVINIMSLLQCNGMTGAVIGAAVSAPVGKSYGRVPDAVQLVKQMNDIYTSFFPLIENYRV